MWLYAEFEEKKIKFGAVRKNSFWRTVVIYRTLIRTPRNYMEGVRVFVK